MPRLIFKCPHIKGTSAGNAAHLENYVNYVATRDGAERVDPGKVNLPATEKQRMMVARLIKDFPDSRGSFEYEDYRASPTRGNASDFITRTIEDNYIRIAKRENYLDYIAKRPRAQRMGSHGLFTGGEDALVLSRVADAVARHPGVVWLPIISLRREDAARLGYDDAEKWRSLLSGYAPELSQAMKIPWEQFRWYAAYHDEGHHPHVHMVCYSEDSTAGFLTKDGIAQIKAGLVQRIFSQDLTEIYASQSQQRNQLGKDAHAVMMQLINQMSSGVLENKKIEQLMAHLSERLQFTNGKKQYGYLKANLKNVVDEIVDELARDKRVGEAYRLWYNLREAVLHSYRDELPERLPLSKQKEFKQIKNMVIQEAMRLGSVELLEPAGPLPESPPEEENLVAEPNDSAPPSDGDAVSLPEGEGKSGSPIDWSEEYKRAREFLYGSDEVEQDLEMAYALFTEETQCGNALAMCDLGRMLADGLGCETDSAASYEWYQRALELFLAEEEERPGRYVEYRIGKFYAWGLGTPQELSEAADWFAKSAEKNYKYAQHSLAGLYRDGKGVEQDSALALHLYESAAVQQFPYASFEAGKMYRDGVGAEKDAARAENYFCDAYQGFCSLEAQSHDDKLQYRLGWMLLHGVGAVQDETAAREYFRSAAKLGNANAQYQLAKLILKDDSATPEQIEEAMAWLEKSAESGQSAGQYTLAKLLRDGGPVEKDITRAVVLFTAAAEQKNDYAAYALGKLYQDGDEGLEQDITAAVHWLTRSAELGNQYAQYRLGKLYQEGDGELVKDTTAAVRWLTLSAEQGNQFAQYRLGKLYQDGDEVVKKDIDAAVRWLTQSAEQGNQFAQYRLGKLYLLGRDVERNKDTAIRWFTLSAEQGNEYAQFFLDHMDDPYTMPLPLAVTKLLHHLSNIFREQESRSPGQPAVCFLDRKLLRKIKEKKIAQGHKRNDHEPAMSY